MLLQLESSGGYIGWHDCRYTPQGVSNELDPYLRVVRHSVGCLKSFAASTPACAHMTHRCQATSPLAKRQTHHSWALR